MIESSGRRETPESIAEAKAREAKKQAKLSTTTPSELDLDDTDLVIDETGVHREIVASDQEFEDPEDIVFDETSYPVGEASKNIFDANFCNRFFGPEPS